MNPKEIRWKQRFSNFEKAFLQLEEAVKRLDSLDDLAKEGLIQRFEYTFELAWKTMKDYLESKNVEARFPRDVIKAGFQYELILDGELWLEMLEMRNDTSHAYDEKKFKVILDAIVHRFFTAIKNLKIYFSNQK